MNHKTSTPGTHNRFTHQWKRFSRREQLFADNYHLFRGTPSALWLGHSFEHVFDIDVPLSTDTATHYYEHIDARLAEPEYLPRSLFERFNVEVLATTEGALDDLMWHHQIRESGWSGRVVTTYHPDAVVNP